MNVIPSASYVGLDVALKDTAVCVLDQNGQIIFEGKVATDPDVLAHCIRERAPDVVRVRLEAGSCSAWLWRGLNRHGLPAVCLDSRHAHRVLSMRKHKTDRNDARGLAELVRMGWYREARVRSQGAQFVRSLLTAREQLLRMRCDFANVLRGTLKALGVRTGPTAGRNFLARVREFQADNDWIAPSWRP